MSGHVHFDEDVELGVGFLGRPRLQVDDDSLQVLDRLQHSRQTAHTLSHSQNQGSTVNPIVVVFALRAQVAQENFFFRKAWVWLSKH